MVRVLRRAYRAGAAPVKRMPQRSPYRILVGAVLSTRTQDPVTAAAATRLLRSAPSPARLARLSPARIERLIFPVGFYRTKARALPRLGQMLVERWAGRVPDRFEELLELPDVGRKVANIVRSKGFGIPAIAVDTHVLRISNRLGLVRTRTPEQTEKQLAGVLPRRHWIEWNYLLVAHGQTVCRPNRPRCLGCPVRHWCLGVGVDRNRCQGRAARPRARAQR